MSTPEVRVSDRRTVEIQRPDHPEHRTSAGRVPIAVQWCQFGFDITTGLLRWCVVYGMPTDPKDEARRARNARGQVMVRRLSVDWGTGHVDVPQWLADEIERYRPAVT